MFTRWDGEFFLHVANNGYSYENTLAFFPLYPMTVMSVGEVVHWMQVDYNLIQSIGVSEDEADALIREAYGDLSDDEIIAAVEYLVQESQ